jgi:chaperonin GroES
MVYTKEELEQLRGRETAVVDKRSSSGEKKNVNLDPNVALENAIDYVGTDGWETEQSKLELEDPRLGTSEHEVVDVQVDTDPIAEFTYRVEPLGDLVVIDPFEETERKVRGLYRPDTAQEKPQIGAIVAVGPDLKLYDKHGRRAEGFINAREGAPRLQVGQVVLYGKYAGTEVDVGDRQYVVIREVDILAIMHKVEGESAEVQWEVDEVVDIMLDAVTGFDEVALFAEVATWSQEQRAAAVVWAEQVREADQGTEVAAPAHVRDYAQRVMSSNQVEVDGYVPGEAETE